MTEFRAYRMDHTGRGIPITDEPFPTEETAAAVITERRKSDNPRSFVNPRPVYWIAERQPSGTWKVLVP